MERTVTATEANREFSEILRQAENGEVVSITRRGRVVARIVPPDDAEVGERIRRKAAFDALMKRLETLKPMNLERITRDDGYD